MRPFALTLTLLAATTMAARADVTPPTIDGPIPTRPFNGPFLGGGTSFDLADVGFIQEEYFISGTATGYTSAAPLTPDGMWTTTPGETTDYKTRLLVYRPEKPKRFKGTVVVEWLNVSGGLDSAPDWISAHNEIIRSGMAWVGVSAQRRGVEVDPSCTSLACLPLKGVNPNRYGSLNHPGDSFSYDVYSQAGQAVLSGDFFDGKPIKRLIAAGESQSAFRMVTYINGVHLRDQVYDGFLVHSRGGDAASLSQSPQVSIPGPEGALIRTDIDVPVLTFQTETDVTDLDSYASRQPDTDNIRLWEVAGTAHADTYTLFAGFEDIGVNPLHMDVVVTASPLPNIIECASPINSGPQHVVLKAAFAALDKWIRTGKAPKSVPLLETNPGPPVTFVVDELGNVRGGIRTPWVDVPIAVHSGLGQSGTQFCGIFGTTTPLDEATLARLYPTDRAYKKAYKKATKRALKAKHIRKKDAKLMRKAAADGYDIFFDFEHLKPPEE